MSATQTPISYLSKFYGRKAQLEVTLADGTVLDIPGNAMQPDALRIVFNVYTVFYQVYWWADIDIYNLDQPTSNQIVQSAGAQQPYIRQGMTAKLSAGYQNGNFGVIWQGTVFQAKFTRENVTDFKITLHCLLWLDPLTRDSVSTAYSAAQSQTSLIENMVGLAFNNAVPVTISPSAKATKQSRGGVVFPSIQQLMDDFADDNNMQWFSSAKGVTVASVDGDVPTTPTVRVFSPPAGPGQSPPQADGVIIGTPEQTQYGVRFKVLLDPNVAVTYPAQVVEIDNTQILMQKRALDQYVNLLDLNGQYIVFAARYYGDTRGVPWYTEIDGLTSVGGKWAAAALLSASKNN